MPTFNENTSSDVYRVHGNTIFVAASGAWDSGTISIQTFGDDSTWHTISSMTADGFKEFINNGRSSWRLVMSGGGASVAVWYDFRAASFIFYSGDLSIPLGALAIGGYAPVVAIT